MYHKIGSIDKEKKAMIKHIVTDKNKLSEKCDSIEDQYQIDIVIKDLIDTAASLENCAGLAAPQINYMARIILVNVQGSNVIMINPAYNQKKGKLMLGNESCFSRPATLKQPIRVKRFNKIQVIYTDPKGNTLIKRFKSFEARLIQHEIDHLNGVLI